MPLPMGGVAAAAPADVAGNACMNGPITTCCCCCCCCCCCADTMAAVEGVGTPPADTAATPVDVDDGRERMSSRVEPTTTGPTAAAAAEREWTADGGGVVKVVCGGSNSCGVASLPLEGEAVLGFVVVVCVVVVVVVVLLTLPPAVRAAVPSMIRQGLYTC
jgi:hypothetical protein